MSRSKSTPGLVESAGKIPLELNIIPRHHTLPPGLMQPSHPHIMPNHRASVDSSISVRYNVVPNQSQHLYQYNQQIMHTFSEPNLHVNDSDSQPQARPVPVNNSAVTSSSISTAGPSFYNIPHPHLYHQQEPQQHQQEHGRQEQQQSPQQQQSQTQQHQQSQSQSQHQQQSQSQSQHQQQSLSQSQHQQQLQHEQQQQEYQQQSPPRSYLHILAESAFSPISSPRKHVSLDAGDNTWTQQDTRSRLAFPCTATPGVAPMLSPSPMRVPVLNLPCQSPSPYGTHLSPYGPPFSPQVPVSPYGGPYSQGFHLVSPIPASMSAVNATASFATNSQPLTPIPQHFAGTHTLHIPQTLPNLAPVSVSSSSGSLLHEPSHDLLLQEITRLRERLVSLETENASMSVKLNQRHWQVENRLAEIEFQMCGSDSNGSYVSGDGTVAPGVEPSSKESVI